MFLCHSTYNIVPEVGDFYFFPNYLMHTVFPFKDSDEELSEYTNIFLKKKLPNPSINYFKSWQELLFLEDKYNNVNLSSVFVKDKNNNYGTVCSSIIGLPNKKKIKNNMVWLYSEYKSSFNHLL